MGFLNKLFRGGLTSAEDYLQRGKDYFNRGDLDRAIVDFTKTMRPDPKSAKPYYNRGVS